MGTSFEAAFDEYINAVVEDIRKDVADAGRKLASVVREKAMQIMREVIDAYYADYIPTYYHPRGRKNLYRLMETGVTDNGEVEIWFDPDRMTPYRSGYTGEDGLYQTVFREGWHGGAKTGPGHPSPGAALGPAAAVYRTPYKIYTFWGRTAYRMATPPLALIQEKIEEYNQNGMVDDFYIIFDGVREGIRITI